MPIVQNKFKGHLVAPDTEILFLGTFSPDIPGAPEFFYGRSRNFLWHLLPKCWGLQPLKDAELSDKKAFMRKFKVDFVDLIDAVDIPEEDEQSDMDDVFIDNKVVEWADLIKVVDSLPKLNAVYLTRKTFNGLKFMRPQISLIAKYCKEKNIRFCKLEPPARFFSDEKQKQWIDTIILKNTCLRV